jgi:anti-sigma regulatory factor (Ser/Thr protein kinase)
VTATRTRTVPRTVPRSDTWRCATPPRRLVGPDQGLLETGWEVDTLRRLAAVRAGLRRWPGLGTVDLDRLLLLVDELASNALRHGGGGPVRVRVVRTAEGVLVDVCDRSVDTPPCPAVDRDPGLGGHGLHLVATLSLAHGWYPQGPVKHVWALVPD